jgi:SPX domain protein involved in polyphosphate accumulation
LTTKDLTFRRKERKYIILEHSFDEIVERIEEHMPIYHFQDKPGLVHIETTYFDTNDFLLYKEYQTRRKFRFKIRMRRYDYEDFRDPEYLVEFKVSHNSMSSKKRFILPEEYYTDFIENKDLKLFVKEANQGLIGAQKTYHIIQELFDINELKPVLRTTYDRIAFQKKSNRVRITVDKGITHNKLLGKSKEETLDAIILESKIMGKCPKWHKKMVNQLSLLYQQRFSKYITGINSLYFPERGKYNFSCDEDMDCPVIPDRIIESFKMLKTILKLDDSALFEE